MEVAMNDSETGVHLKDIGQISLTVLYLARAKNFYQNTLGIQFLFDAGTMVFFQCGPVGLMIGLAEEAAPIGGTILYFKVTDIQAVHRELEGCSVAFVEPPHLVARLPHHDLWMAFLKDPDGNVLGLMSEVARIG